MGLPGLVRCCSIQFARVSSVSSACISCLRPVRTPNYADAWASRSDFLPLRILLFFSLNCWVPSNHGTRHRFGSHWEVQTNRVNHLFAKSSQIDRWAPTILTITRVTRLYHPFRSGFSWMFFVRFISTPSCDPRFDWERKQKLVPRGTVLHTGDRLVGIDDVRGYMATGQIAGDARFASMVSVIALHCNPISGWSSTRGMVGFPNSPAIIPLPADP